MNTAMPPLARAKPQRMSSRTVAQLLRRDLRRSGTAALLTAPAVVVLGAVMVVLTARQHGQYQRLAATVIEAMLPLAAGIAVSGVLGAETALELQLSLPARFQNTLLRRAVLLAVWTGAWAAAAATIVAAARWWTPDGNSVSPATVQLAWLAPTVALCGIGFAVAGQSGGTAGASALVGGIWLVEQLAPLWFHSHTWSQWVYLFPFTRGGVPPEVLPANRSALLIVGLLGLAIGWSGFRTGDLGWSNCSTPPEADSLPGSPGSTSARSPDVSYR